MVDKDKDKKDKAKNKLGEKLIASGVLSEDQLQTALKEQTQRPRLLGQILVQLGFITDQQLLDLLATLTGLPIYEPAVQKIDNAVSSRLPTEMATLYNVLPYRIEGKTLHVIMLDPHDVVAQDIVRRYYAGGLTVQPWLASASTLAGIFGQLNQAAPQRSKTNNIENSVSELVDTIIRESVQTAASDIHLEPEESFVRLRLRCDGILRRVTTYHKDQWPALSQRIKILSGMDIADKLQPQDGRFSQKISGKQVDFRVATMPGVWGENIVIRVLEQRQELHSLEQLGFNTDFLTRLNLLLSRPEGMVLVTGPTGSGKTTTLYSLIQKLADASRNIMTLEDPIEIRLPLIRQTQVRAASLTFAEGTRALMRQDPDVILIGEIRDTETAQMGIRAAMTGHLVFSTLHTLDVFGVVPRLLELGATPGLLSGHLAGIVSQRLVALLCTACKYERPANDDEKKFLNLEKVMDAKGCTHCHNTGRKGRVALGEILVLSEKYEDLIAKGAERRALKLAAREDGFISMAEDGIEKVKQGIITLADLKREVTVT